MGRAPGVVGCRVEWPCLELQLTIFRSATILKRFSSQIDVQTGPSAGGVPRGILRGIPGGTPTLGSPGVPSGVYPWVLPQTPVYTPGAPTGIHRRTTGGTPGNTPWVAARDTPGVPPEDPPDVPPEVPPEIPNRLSQMFPPGVPTPKCYLGALLG